MTVTTPVPLPQRLNLRVEAAKHLPVLLLKEADAVLQVRDPGRCVAADDEAAATAAACLLWRGLLHLETPFEVCSFL